MAIFVALAGLGYCCYSFGLLGTLQPDPTPDRIDAASYDDREISALGRIQPVGGVVSILGPVGDSIKEYVYNDEAVKAGQAIAVLKSQQLTHQQYLAAVAQRSEAEARRDAEIVVAQARVAAADAALSKIESQRSQAELLKKKTELAEANLKFAKSVLKRLTDLPTDLVSQQAVEEQHLAVQHATLKLDAAIAEQTQLNREITSGLSLAKAEKAAAVAGEKLAAVAVPVESLRHAEEIAKLHDQNTTIKSPIDGTILKVYLQEGETIANTPIMQVADLSKIEVIAEVFETDLQHISLHQEARIDSRAFGKPFLIDGMRGNVTKVSGFIAAPALEAIDPFAAVDRRVAEVHVEITGAEAVEHAAKLINLQVEVTFLNQEARVNDNAAGMAQPDSQ